MATSYNVPQHSEQLKISFPAEHVMLLTLNRPKRLNAVGPQLNSDIGAVLNWFEDQPSLWVVIVTGEGRAFCAGADLMAWNEAQQSGDSNESQMLASSLHGFGQISRRQTSNKPIIAAVNGSAYGGGVEMILNCDLVVASDKATFALPEVKRGVVAAQGVIPRLARVSGHQLASEMLLLGNNVSAAEARDRFGFVNRVVPADTVLSTALDLAKDIISNSPDSVQSSKRGLILSQQLPVEEAVRAHALGDAGRRVYKSENIREGLMAFAEKRKPKWKSPAKL
ncbi:ClpP crotonase [Coniophora puteana RWD-64-598 SS2]|uniref:ClpP crotonase n=1 Tax=Coniophora puteana (strain RWD-64-598) TaxID=741705 RepID=A0A5M3MWS9_CONPW|nr:ClpP crotonase [Coniophora puteana RWD-64-598 SS2]EIW83598.1 ClpP crotonase [Coniophora puteana RWD-64-598 SS2]